MDNIMRLCHPAAEDVIGKCRHVEAKVDIKEISDRMEIADVLLLFGRGIDRNDVSLVEQAFHEGASLSLGYYVGELQGYLDRFRMMAQSPIQPLSGTQHRIGNISIEVSGDTARVESYTDVCWRRHHPDGTVVDELAAARALDNMERRDGRWAITSRKLVWDWAATIAAGVLPWQDSETHLPGRRDAEDPAIVFWK